jgi:hypothetical protein
MTTSGSARASGGARPACDAGHSRPMVRPQHHPKWVRRGLQNLPPGTRPRRNGRPRAPCGVRGHSAGCWRAGLGRPPACVSRPTRACCRVVGDPGWAMGYAVLAMLTRRPAGPGDCSGRDQAVQSVDELEESVSGCGDRPGPAEMWGWTAIVLGDGWPVARSTAWPTRRGWVRARISRRSGAPAQQGSPLLWQAARHVTSTIAAQNRPRTVCLPRRRPRRGRPAALASCDPQAATPVQ